MTAHTKTLRMLSEMSYAKCAYLVEVVSSLPQTKHLLFIWSCLALSRKLKLEGKSSVRKTFDQDPRSRQN